jgi:hypothetical protein
MIVLTFLKFLKWTKKIQLIMHYQLTNYKNLKNLAVKELYN